MIKWLPFELHCHTVHSDASHTLLELANSAKARGLEGFALTDHNTVSGWLECSDVSSQTGLYILKGMECTTFYGHMIVLGLDEYEDWREFTPENINEKIKDIRSKGGIVGLAHPFDIGSPICTGGHWEFKISDWNYINYLEAWSSVFPPTKDFNKRCFEFWTGLLNEGYRITAVSGRDWHSSEYEEKIYAVTYLGIKENAADVEHGALQALTEGCVVVSLGPLMELFVKTVSGKEYHIGEEAVINDSNTELKVSIAIEFTGRNYECKLDCDSVFIDLISNLGSMGKLNLPACSLKKDIYISAKGVKWLRAELYGTVKGKNTMIAFTNPIYLKC